VFRAPATTLPELFANAAVAMLSIACEPYAVASRLEYSLAAAGADWESLPVNSLSEVFYWFGDERIALREFRVMHLQPDAIRRRSR
jgi:SHS2 domain-containing protein